MLFVPKLADPLNYCSEEIVSSIAHTTPSVSLED